MKLVELNNVFEVRYGVNLALNKLSVSDHGIPFVSRTSKNNGVSARVEKVDDLDPNPPHTLSVAAGGSVLATFYQPEPYYSGRDLYYLLPREEMSVKEMLIYSKLINSNAYKYNYGRQANKTLSELLIPDRSEIKDWLNEIVVMEEPTSKPFGVGGEVSLSERIWNDFLLSDLFDITGTQTTPEKRLEEYGRGKYPYVTTRSSNNGVKDFFDHCTETGNVLVIDSAVAGHCTYQGDDFSASDHVEKLIPRFRLNQFIAMFLTTVINCSRFRYSYGRKASQERLRKDKIRLPSTANGSPDWEYMERFIKS